MKKYLISLALITLVFFLQTGYAYFPANESRSQEYQAERLIVKFKSGHNPEKISVDNGIINTGFGSFDRINSEFNVNSIKSFLPENSITPKAPSFDNIFIITSEDISDLEALELEYENLPFIDYVEPDYMVELYESPDDPLYDFQWSLNNIGLQHFHVLRNWGSRNDSLILTVGIPDSDIDAEEVYQNPPDKTVTVVVAIIDTGVDLDHPDLADNIWVNPGEIPDNGIDDDHNGYIDDMNGWDVASSSDFDAPGDNDPTDNHGHGTHCAGIVAGVTNNDLGIAGIATDCKIMALNFDPLPLISRVAAAILYAADNGADVINMSFGLNFRSDLIEEAIGYAYQKGVVMCAASGNSGSRDFNFPAAYPTTITVGASNDSDLLTSFSTFGDHISVVAPGQSILSLRADNTDMYGSDYPYEPNVHIINENYYLASGTSMACPHAVGVAAVMRSVSPGLTPARVQQIMEQTADDIIDPYGVGWNMPGYDEYTGHGRINLPAALAAIPDVRAHISSPRQNQIISDTIDIIGIADGDDFESYFLDYGEGNNPDDWVTIASSNIPVTDGSLGSWDISSLAGTYTLKLSAGDDNITYKTVFIANQSDVQITYPSDGSTISNYTEISGDAYAPDFTHITAEYRVDSMNAEWAHIDSLTIPVENDNIAAWYLEGLPQNNYQLCVAVWNNDVIVGADTIVVEVQSIFDTENAWKNEVGGYPSIITNYGDLDGDGNNEIIVGTSSGIEFYNTDGTIKTDGVPNIPRNNFIIPPAVGNLDNDGVEDMVAIGYDPPYIYGFPSSAEPFEVPMGVFPPIGNFYRTEHEFPKIYLKDIDKDGTDEVIAFIYDYSFSKTFLLESNGEVINTFNYYSEFLAADIDGDQLDEIYVSNRAFGMLRRIDPHTGLTFDSLILSEEGSYYNITNLAAFDIDNDNKHELIVSGYYYDFGYYVYAFDENLQLKDGWPHNMNIDTYVVPTAPVFGDLDGDGQPEYLTCYFDLSASYILAWNIDGTPYIPGTNGLFAVTPEPSVLNMLLLADINGDNETDIIACADNDMFGTYNVQRIFAWNNEAQIISGFPIITDPDAFTSDRFTPSIGDINKDGNVDLIMTASDESQLFVNFPGIAYNDCASPAPFWRYNRRMNNVASLVCDSIPTDVDDGNRGVIPSDYALGQNYPNPFNPTTIIEYSIPKRSHIEISIFNILGRKVTSLVNSSHEAGKYSIQWDGRDQQGQEVASGIYFYNFKSDYYTETKKMILLR